MPPATIEAFRDHGDVRRTLDEAVDAARKVLSDLGTAGISLDAVTDQLQKDGGEAFAKSFGQINEPTAAKAEKIAKVTAA